MGTALREMVEPKMAEPWSEDIALLALVGEKALAGESFQARLRFAEQ